nr:hypothetical protein [Tenuifilaceae bacterium]
MKRIATILAICLATSMFAKSQEVFLYEGFETGGKPAGWTEQRLNGTTYWGYVDGGGAYSGNPDLRHPPAAYAGGFNALFQVEGTGPSSRIFTYPIDLRFSIKPVLSFWLAMDEWDFNTDLLEVFYRVSTTSPWITLETFTAPVSVWSEREIVLPAEVKVETCQIAFVATSNYGWGVCLDEIKIDERGVVPRTVRSVTAFQVKDAAPTETTGNPVAFVEIAVDGNSNDLPVTNAVFTYNGTSIADISNFSLFYTRDSIFDSSAPIQYTTNIVGNSIEFSNGQQFLSTGYNYIWICADVSSEAVHNNKIDVYLDANSLTIGGNTFPSNSQSPTGVVTIEESLVAYNFESSNGWTLNDSWQIGTPIGVGTYDPENSFSGSGVMATNLEGNYPASITIPHMATSNPVNAKYYQNLNVRYKRWLNIEATDKSRVWLSNNGGSTWIKLMENTTGIQDRNWRSFAHGISSYATRKGDVRVRFAIDESDASTEYGGWNIDNFAVTGDYIAHDVGVKEFTSPISHCGLGMETVKIVVKNYGGDPVATPFLVGYSLNNGASYTTETFNHELVNDEATEGDN